MDRSSDRLLVITEVDLQAFPFDTVELDIVLSFGWNSNELQVVPGPVDVSEAVHSSSEYVLTGRKVAVKDTRYSYFERYDSSASYPHMTVTLQLTRKPLYYMRLVLTLLAVTCMEITSFLLPATDLSDRFGVSGTVVLAAIGFHYMAAEHLPKLAYLTRLDHYIVWCYMLIFGSFIENLVAFSTVQSFPGGDKATTNSALMECYASWSRLACDSDGLARLELQLAWVYIGLAVGGTIWFAWPLRGSLRQAADAEARRAEEKVKLTLSRQDSLDARHGKSKAKKSQ